MTQETVLEPTTKTSSQNLCHQLETLVLAMLDSDVDLQYAKLSLEKAYIREVLKRHGGNIGQTALALGIHRNTLSKRIRDLDLKDFTH